MEVQKMPVKSATTNGAPSIPEERLLRAAEVQRELGVSRATTYRLMTDGTLPVYRFGGRRGQRAMVRVAWKDLREWLASHKSSPQSAG